MSYGEGYRDARKHAQHEAQILVRNATQDLHRQVQRLLDALIIEKDAAKEREARVVALETEVERLKEGLWQCGFWARNTYTNEKHARMRVVREVRQHLSEEEFTPRRMDVVDLDDVWED